MSNRTRINVQIDDVALSNQLFNSLKENSLWFDDEFDGIVSYDFSGIYHDGDVFLIEKDAPLQFTINEYDEALCMSGSCPRNLGEVVPFFKELTELYLKQVYEPEGTVFFDLLIAQLEERGGEIGPISIVYEELDEEDSFHGEFSYADHVESYSDSSDPEKNSLLR